MADPPSMPEPSSAPVGDAFAPPVGSPSVPPITTVATSAATSPISARKVGRKRPSRWDRPKEPHDWRWVVGHIGRTLITVGLLMFGFVAYQLWGTGLQTARAQDHLENEFNDQLEAAGIVPDTIAPATTTTTAVAPATVDTGVLVDPAATTTTLTPEAATTLAPVEQPYGNIAPGDSLGVIKIPKIGLNFYIVAGVSKQNLRDGIGHFPNTPLPGQLGNAALAGHRTTYLAPFYDLDDMQAGDEIQFTTILGDAYVYIVTDSIVVNPSDYNVVTDSDPNVATLTLITCTPIGTSSQRLVVHATLDASRGSQVGAPLIYYGEGTDDGTFDASLPDEDGTGGEDGALPPEETSTTTAGTAETLPADPAATTLPTEAATTTIAGAVTDASAPGSIDPVEEFSDDAFSAGWFDDSAAFPHVAFWLALWALVWYGAYRLAKWRRNAWIGLVVGLAPFVVTLFFLYENVNRLLPAAI